MGTGNMWARIKPHVHGGHRCRRYSVDGILFTLDGGWKQVTNQMAKDLTAKLDSDKRPIFDVMDRDAAVEVDKTEEQEKRGAPEPTAEVALGRTDAPDVSDLSIKDYGKLTAKRIVRIADKGKLTDRQIAEVIQFEETHDNRKTVLSALRRAAKALKE